MDLLRNVLLVAMMVIPLALAGCAADAGNDEADDEPQDMVDSTPSLQAVITVSVNGTLAEPANGIVTVPLGLTATFDGSASTGAILTYAWDFGDNTTGADTEETHLYAEPGLYNVTLTVANGNLTSNATLAVPVVGVAKGSFLARQKTHFEGRLPVMNPNSCTNQGVDCQDIAIPVVAEINGTPVVANHVWVNVTAGGSPGSAIQVFWRSPEGTALAQTAAEGTAHNLEYAGDMAAGDYVVRVRLFVGLNVAFQGDAAVTYVTA